MMNDEWGRTGRLAFIIHHSAFIIYFISLRAKTYCEAK